MCYTLRKKYPYFELCWTEYGEVRSMQSLQQKKKKKKKNQTKLTSKCIFCYNTVNKREYTRPVILLKNRLWHRCFPMDFAKFLRTPYLQNATGGCF